MHQTRIAFAAVPVLAFALTAGCQTTSRAVIHPGLGTYHRAVTTSSPEAQR